MQGEQHCDRKQSGCQRQPERIFRQKAETIKENCVEPNCRSKRMLAINICKHAELGGDGKRKGQAIQF